MRELRAGCNFESQDPVEAHSGLGPGTVAASVRVRWADGGSTTLRDVAADRLLRIVVPNSPTATVTATPTPTATLTPSSSASPTGTVTASATATALPPPCIGDCDGDGTVTIEELLRGVRITLGQSSLALCRAVDLDRDQAVGVDELVGAVDAALGGCAAARRH